MNMDKENEDDERTEYAENPEDSHHGIHLAPSSPRLSVNPYHAALPSGRADSFSHPLQGKGKQSWKQEPLLQAQRKESRCFMIRQRG